MSKSIQWTDEDNLYVVRLGRTSNSKIADPKQEIVQTYTFSRKQLALVRSCGHRHKVDMQTFYRLDETNCLDCPLSGNSGNGKCYTHKFGQFRGFVSMLRRIAFREEVYQGLNAEDRATIVKWCEGRYVRFGTYGEPSLLPIDLVGDMVLGASSWTGYTHQARKPWSQPYRAFFMASAHSDKDAASIMGWRSFVAYDPKTSTSTAVMCPASKEAGYKSICSKCSLCSGMAGKGIKNVAIHNH